MKNQIMPDPDSHFRLLPCRRCQCQTVGYCGTAEGWKVVCDVCGMTSGTHPTRHGAQVAWNTGEVLESSCNHAKAAKTE